MVGYNSRPVVAELRNNKSLANVLHKCFPMRALTKPSGPTFIISNVDVLP